MAKTNGTGNNHRPSTPTMSGPALRVQRANRFVLDSAGYWHCTVASIAPQDAPDGLAGDTTPDADTARALFEEFSKPRKRRALFQ